MTIRKLRVFELADALVIDIYRVSNAFPDAERFGLQAQLRRAAVSSAANIVEGCARRTTGEYVNLLSVAAGSTSEGRYLLDVAARLGFLPTAQVVPILERYSALAASLEALIRSHSRDREPRTLSPKP